MDAVAQEHSFPALPLINAVQFFSTQKVLKLVPLFALDFKRLGAVANGSFKFVELLLQEVIILLEQDKISLHLGLNIRIAPSTDQMTTLAQHQAAFEAPALSNSIRSLRTRLGTRMEV